MPGTKSMPWCSMGDYWEMLLPSEFAEPTPLLQELASQLEVSRRDDPLSVLRELNQRLYDYFDYVPKSTKVDSPIDDAIKSRQGVCQDFAHIMIALVRSLRIPCRYVSGYLYRRAQDHDRSVVDATHAWVEAFLPPSGLGGIRSHQLSACRRPPHSYRDRPRLRRRAPDARHFSRTHRQRLVGRGAGDGFGRRSGTRPDLPVPEEWSVLVEKAQEPPPAPTKSMQQEQQQQQQ